MTTDEIPDVPEQLPGVEFTLPGCRLCGEPLQPGQPLIPVVSFDDGIPPSRAETESVHLACVVPASEVPGTGGEESI